MSHYQTSIGQILKVYARHAKAGPGSTPNQALDPKAQEPASFAMTLQKRLKLEQLAIENMNRITRKNGNSGDVNT